MRDLTILMDLELGRPADLLTVAAAEDIPIIAGCVFPRLAGRVAHFAVREQDVDRVSAIVREQGAVLADDRECIVLPPDFPGGAPVASKRIADAGIMVQVGYFGARGEIILATADVAGTKAALGID